MLVLHSFLWPNNIPLLFIHILIGGHLGFYSLVLINNALYLYVKVFAWSYNFIFLGSVPRNEIAGSNGLTSWETARLFSKMVTIFFLIPTSSVQGFLFLHIFTNACYYLTYY